ncbi:MAG: hypothetical protein WD872_16175 [Pirellulaceae bacterium]
MNRRKWFRSCALATLSLPLFAWRGVAQEGGNPTLADTLRVGLRCRREAEIAFVNLVVARVNERRIPEAMVLKLFDYARARRPKLPFPYFEAAMRKQAVSLGVTL